MIESIVQALPIEENMTDYQSIKEQNIFFCLSDSILQELSLEELSRELEQTELNNLRNTILYLFKNWDNWIKELIAEEYSKQ